MGGTAAVFVPNASAEECAGAGGVGGVVLAVSICEPDAGPASTSPLFDPCTPRIPCSPCPSLGAWRLHTDCVCVKGTRGDQRVAWGPRHVRHLVSRVCCTHTHTHLANVAMNLANDLFPLTFFRVERRIPFLPMRKKKCASAQIGFEHACSAHRRACLHCRSNCAPICPGVVRKYFFKRYGMF